MSKKTNEDSGPRYSAPALEKGLDILELLTDSHDGFTLNEIARQLNRTVNELFRMVITLERRGWVVVDENDRYSLSLRMFELAYKHLPLRSLVSAATPLMRRLVVKSRQSCHLTVMQAGRVVVIAQVDGPERWSFGLKVGAIIGLHDTASGHVLLAFRENHEREQILNLHADVEGESLIDNSQLMSILDEIKACGYAQTQSQQVKGITNIAYPIFGADQEIIACLNVPYIERVDKKIIPSIAEARKIVSDYAEELSILMGNSSYLFN